MFSELPVPVKTQACPRCHQPLSIQPPVSVSAAPRLFCAACKLMVDLPESTPPHSPRTGERKLSASQALCLYRPMQQPTQHLTFFSKLPVDLNRPIFSFLSQRDLSASLGVSRAWSKRLQEQELCRVLLARDFNMYVRPDEDAAFIYQVVSQNPHHHFALSEQHQLFLKSTGEVWALGNNYLNKLGMGKIGTQLPFPHNRGVIDEDGVCKAPSLVKAFAGRRIVQVATGVFHTLFLESTGQVWACGDNDEGQLGFGVREPYNQRPLSPVLALAGHKIVQVAVGPKHSLFLEDNGQVWGCGEGQGSLGIGPVKSYQSPKEPVLIKIFKGHIIRRIVTSKVYLSYSANSFFISSKGEVFYSGGSVPGGAATDSVKRIWALKQEKIISVVQGDGHTLFLSVEGRVWAGGANNEGQLGLGHTEDSRAKSPTLIQALVGQRVIQIAVGHSHSLFLTDKGEVWGCGDNSSFQLGQLGVKQQWEPCVLPNLQRYFVREVAANSTNSFFITRQGEVLACGYTGNLPTMEASPPRHYFHPQPIATLTLF